MTGNAYGTSSLLIATDGSAYADVAAEYSAWLAARLEARITALYVIDARRLAGHFIKHLAEILESSPSAGLTDRVRDYYRRQGMEALKRAAGICERYGVTCETDLKTGNVVKVIADAAVNSDLLVIGERGEDKEFETGFLGSVTERLVRKVKRPVLLTGLEFREFRRALLAYDGSEGARGAMKMLARLAVALKMDVDAVQMVEEGEPTTALNEVITYFKDYPVHLSTHYLRGDSHSVIIDHAKEIGCDLMVMGAYENWVADTMALGTTTDYLIRNSPVPVLVHH
ncbi:MAG TPA: universal stress protein [Pyrinomonadaceae bacterium]|nr:universal stress protein [Pyrinomonadaceae bacterium]